MIKTFSDQVDIWNVKIRQGVRTTNEERTATRVPTLQLLTSLSSAWPSSPLLFSPHTDQSALTPTNSYFQHGHAVSLPNLPTTRNSNLKSLKTYEALVVVSCVRSVFHSPSNAVRSTKPNFFPPTTKASKCCGRDLDQALCNFNAELSAQLVRKAQRE